VARLEDHRAHGGLHDEQEGRDEERIMQFEGRIMEEQEAGAEAAASGLWG